MLLKRLKKLYRNHKKILIGGIILSIWLIIVATGNIIAPYGVNEMFVGPTLKSPSSRYFFGTDEFGRDVFSRVIFGSRITLLIGFGISMTAMLVGSSIGITGAYLGSYWDSLTIRLADLLFSLPAILLALFISAILGPGLRVVIIGLVIAFIPQFIRVSRGSVINIKEKDYVKSAEALGCNDVRILFKHILPNSIAPIIVQQTIIMAYSILMGAALSYLGVGVQPPTPSWGLMLSTGSEFLMSARWLTIYPGLILSLMVFGITMFNEGLRDLIDPKVGR